LAALDAVRTANHLEYREQANCMRKDSRIQLRDNPALIFERFHRRANESCDLHMGNPKSRGFELTNGS